MFYEAMIDLGVDENYAKLLYYGVRLGGPRWKLETASARSMDDLEYEVRTAGGTIIGTVETKGSSGIAGGRTTYLAHIFVPLPLKPLSEQEINRFRDELKQRQISGGTITPAEIESRTEHP
jgi:hypothetical protein